MDIDFVLYADETLGHERDCWLCRGTGTLPNLFDENILEMCFFC